MKIYYLVSKGKFTEDPAKAKFGKVETADVKLPRFFPMHTGSELIWIEQDIGLPEVAKKVAKKK